MTAHRDVMAASREPFLTAWPFRDAGPGKRVGGRVHKVLVLADTRPEAIAESLCALLDDRELFARMSVARSPYGDGRSAEKICDFVEEYLAAGARPGETSMQD